MPVLGFLKELPNRTIPHNTANNLTQVSYIQSNKHNNNNKHSVWCNSSVMPFFPPTQTFLKSVEEVLSSPGLPEVNHFYFYFFAGVVQPLRMTPFNVYNKMYIWV